MWQFAPNSVHYLLNLWQRMVASVPYVKSSEPHLLEQYTPEVTKAYITSRLESVHVVLRSVTSYRLRITAIRPLLFKTHVIFYGLVNFIIIIK